jgi:hypothetical protein
LNRRNLAIVALCCLPTIAITTVVAQRYSPDERGVGGSPASAAHVDEAVGRVVAQPMRPGEPVGPAAVVASVSYEGDVAGLPKTAAVFVFARRSGERMPVAVERLAPARLPVDVVFRHEAGAELEIVARVSLLGGAKLEEGDVESAVTVVAPGEGEKVIALRLPGI